MSATATPDESYDADFQSFMMAGRKAERMASPQVTALHKEQQFDKQCWVILRAFQGILQRDWLEVDRKLGTVIGSIANLRHRIYWESQLSKQKDASKFFCIQLR